MFACITWFFTYWCRYLLYKTTYNISGFVWTLYKNIKHPKVSDWSTCSPKLSRIFFLRQPDSWQYSTICIRSAARSKKDHRKRKFKQACRRLINYQIKVSTGFFWWAILWAWRLLLALRPAQNKLLQYILKCLQQF